MTALMHAATRATLVLAVALSACGQDAGRNDAATEGVATNDIAAEAVPAQPPEPANSATEPADPPTNGAADESTAKTIPAALHGRWGLVPGDCTSTLGDAKGLVIVNADRIRFYESVARPAKIIERTDSKIRGEFGFTGEGMEWSKSMTWSAAGNKLTRVDSEAKSRLVYTRC